MRIVVEVALWLAFLAATPFIAVAWLFLVLAQGRWTFASTFVAIAIPLAWCAAAFALLFWTGPGGDALLIGFAILVAFFLLRRRLRRPPNPARRTFSTPRILRAQEPGVPDAAGDGKSSEGGQVRLPGSGLRPAHRPRDSGQAGRR